LPAARTTLMPGYSVIIYYTHNDLMKKALGLNKILIRAVFIGLFSAAAGLIVNLVSPGKIPYIHRQPDSVSISGGRVRIINVAETYALFQKGEAVFIDARSADLYQQGHITGALSLPAYEADDYLDAVLSKVSPEKTLVTYCNGVECDESHMAADMLMQLGYKNIIIFASGFPAWREAGLPVSTDEERSL